MGNLDTLKQLLAKIPQKRLAILGSYLFLSVFCYQSAVLTWQLWRIKSPNVAPWQPLSASVSDKSVLFELATLRSLYLFGKQEAIISVPVAIQNVDAPKTSLSLTLAGVVASSDPNLALAIIENKGRQDTYAIGDAIGLTHAILKQVFPDRVLIEYQGNLETLMLDGESFTRGSGGHNIQGKTLPEHSSQNLTQLRKELLVSPAHITDYVRISPIRINGKLTGYRVNPGKKRTLFEEVGLQPNDIAVSLNGYDLTDTRQAMEIAGQLKDLTEMSLTVERDGQLHSIYLSLPN